MTGPGAAATMAATEADCFLAGVPAAAAGGADPPDPSRLRLPASFPLFLPSSLPRYPVPSRPGSRCRLGCGGRLRRLPEGARGLRGRRDGGGPARTCPQHASLGHAPLRCARLTLAMPCRVRPSGHAPQRTASPHRDALGVTASPGGVR